VEAPDHDEGEETIPQRRRPWQITHVQTELLYNEGAIPRLYMCLKTRCARRNICKHYNYHHPTTNNRKV